MTVPKRYQNPVTPGFHPDPSVCRAGSDYYLVCNPGKDSKLEHTEATGITSYLRRAAPSTGTW